jgi:hypothetical protein
MVGRARALALIFLVSCFYSRVEAVELRPWFGNYLEFEFRSHLLYQNYKALARGADSIAHSSDDLFLDMSLGFVPDPQLSVEAEIECANTTHNHGVDHFSFTGRYMLLNDIAGDAISLVAGLTLQQAFIGSLRDMSSFHHGRSEAEFHLAVGKELCSNRFLWDSRLWAIGAFGFAEQGKPWLRANLGYDYRLAIYHELSVFAKTLWGMGNKKLNPYDFDGYGSLHHQSVDLGLRYTYLIEFFGSASIEYMHRVYARNFPAEAHLLMISVLYTFSL